MNAKEYLMQAKFLDMRINSKIQQVEALNDLATSASSVLTGMPRNPNTATSKMADAVCKIVDLQAEINRDIDELVDLKKEISSTIKAVPSPELQTLLEKRYLCFQSWEVIAVDMGYSMHHLYKLHNQALDICDGILKRDT